MTGPDLHHMRDSSDGSEVAIIGMAGRFPGARNTAEFWQNLTQGVESITRFSDEELSSLGMDSTTLSDPDFVKATAALDDVEMFDAPFFGINSRDAAIMDPQHRFFLECAWEAVEDAGYDAERFDGSIGVFAGSGMNTYMLFNLAPNADLMRSLGLFHIRHLGNDKDFLTTRVSYHLNLKGPSINVQTACSTSLVAVHLACQSLLNGECDMALAGGVTIKVPHKQGYWYRKGEIQSPDGHCRPFDVKADGTVFGSGAGVVVLRRLADALAAGDHIYAVIKGSAINNDGSLKVGYMAPSVQGYAAAVSEALMVAGVDAETLSYVSAHGTATPMGDAIEVSALTQAFRASTRKKQFCAVSSVKANIGHVDMAAGVASLMAAALSLKNRVLPPSVNFEEPNPEINFGNTPFYVNTALTNWKANRWPRRAGVSSLGIGGTNAFVVLEEAQIVNSPESGRPWQLLALSARTPSALDRATTNLIEHLRRHPDLNLADVAYTCLTGRKAFNCRRTVVCRTVADAVNALATADPHQVATAVQEHRDRPVAFVFPGDVTLPENAGLELYQTERVFREHVDRCSELLKPHTGFVLREALYPALNGKEGVTESAWLHSKAGVAERSPVRVMNDATLFTLEYALAGLCLSWGLHAQALSGYGVGEYVAGCLAGVLSLNDALSLVIARAQLIDEAPARSPVAPSAFALASPRIPCISGATGEWLTDGQATNLAYWVERVQHVGHVNQNLPHLLLRNPEWVCLEIGPGAEQPSERATVQRVLSCLPSEGDSSSVVSFLLNTFGRLWLEGVKIDWSAFYANETRRRIPLPTYPFERQYYWIDPPDKSHVSAKSGLADHLPQPQLGVQATYVAPRNETEQILAEFWQNTLGIERVGIYDRFFDLGGNSLLAANLFAQINQRFGRTLPLATLFEAPTIAELSGILSKQDWTARWSPLVAIQPAGSQPPFFCVHAFRGNVLSYYGLARHMGTDRPFFALQARGLDGQPVGEVRLEDMAAYYIDEIRAIQPHGPYFLGGWCFGGEVAYEMAQQLQAQGEAVALVAMFQNPDRDSLKAMSEVSLLYRATHGVLDSVDNELSYLAGMDSQARLAHLLQRAGRFREIVQAKIERMLSRLPIRRRFDSRRSMPYALDSLAQAHTRAYWKHTPQPYRGRVALFWASKQPRGMSRDPGAGWANLVQGELIVRKVPGHHHGSFLAEPHVCVLAEQLKALMDEAE